MGHFEKGKWYEESWFVIFRKGNSHRRSSNYSAECYARIAAEYYTKDNPGATATIYKNGSFIDTIPDLFTRLGECGS